MRQEQQSDDHYSHYSVEFSEPFEADLDVCYLRLFRVSPKAARRWQEGILTACFSLSQFPRRCQVAPEAQSFGREVRLLLYRNRRAIYRVLYTIFDPTEDTSGIVRLLHVRQGARQEQELDADEET